VRSKLIYLLVYLLNAARAVTIRYSAVVQLDCWKTLMLLRRFHHDIMQIVTSQ